MGEALEALFEDHPGPDPPRGDTLRQIELHGPQEPYRAQLIRAVRSLLAQDPEDEHPRSAA